MAELVLPALSVMVTVASAVAGLAESGWPLITPVAVAIVRPGGSPEAA